MPALAMKEKRNPAATKKNLEDKFVAVPTSCTKAAEMAWSWKIGPKPKSTSLGMPQAPAQHRAARHRLHLAWLLAQELRSHFMSKHKCKALILDSDPDALITLQSTLENGGVDTTITWDNAEARNLVTTTPFDVMLIGDHPPEISLESTLRDLRARGELSPCLVLRVTATGKMPAETLRQLGVAGVLSKREPERVLEEVQKALA